jgi:hypothetical protein
MVAWRDQHVPEKELWLTEFGWDASTKLPPPTGDFAKWEGSTETQQAQWIVRAWLLAAREGIDRAYLFFFNDDDKPQVHGSAGVTRHFEPKPSYHASVWLQRSLGEYRFARVIREEESDCFAYEFTHGSEPQKRVLAVWKPAGDAAIASLPLGPGKVVRVERMLLSAAPPAAESFDVKKDELSVRADGSPLLVWVE